MTTLLDGPAYYGHTIFCDDIRHEAGGKTTYVGTYSGQLLIHGDFPAILPKFGLGISYIQKVQNFIPPTKFLIFLPGDEAEPSAEYLVDPKHMDAALERAKTEPTEHGILTAQAQVIFSPLVLKVPGEIKVRALRGDNELVRLGILIVKPAPNKVKESE